MVCVDAIYGHGSQALISIIGPNSSAKAEQPQICETEQCQDGQTCDCCSTEAQEREENYFPGLAWYARRSLSNLWQAANKMAALLAFVVCGGLIVELISRVFLK